MKKSKALLDFISLSAAIKIAFYRNVITKLSGNATFPTPDVPLDEVISAVDDLDAAFQATKDGSHVAVSAMHDAEDVADNLFRILAAYVNRMAAGKETEILSSGFHVSKQQASIQKPELAAQDGDNSGNVWLVARAVENAGAYIWQYAKDSLPEMEESWTVAGHSTQSYFQVEKLAVASKYYFRLAAITNIGITDYTAPVLKVVV